MMALIKSIWWRLTTSRQCSWCKRWKYRAPGYWLGLRRHRVSHGMCQMCFKNIVAESRTA